MISYDIDSLLYVGRYKAAKRISYMFPSSFAADKLFIKNNKKIKQKEKDAVCNGGHFNAGLNV